MTEPMAEYPLLRADFYFFMFHFALHGVTAFCSADGPNPSP